MTNVDGDSFFFGDFAELKMAEPLVIALREVAGRYGFAWEDRETHEVEQARG